MSPLKNWIFFEGEKMSVCMRFFIFLCLLSISQFSAADIIDYNLWSAMRFTGQLSEGDNNFYVVSTHLRFKEQDDPFRQNVETFIIGRYLNDADVLAIGYEMLPTVIPLGLIIEYRFMEEYKFKKKVKRSVFSLRSRLEERWIDKVPGVYLRLREKIAITFPKLFQSNIYPRIYSETFFRLNNVKWSNPSIIDQQRSYIGIEKKLSPAYRLNVGYLNQYVPLRDINLSIHILSVALTKKFI
jgi:hypothetical protein